MSKARLIPFVVLWTLAGQALPAQTVTLTLPDGADSLRNTLENSSLTLSLSDVAPGSSQDYIAAARSDYRRLLTGLYAQGHYGGTISILIDGREAAGIAPLDAPAQISTIQIIVQPGPQFTFGRTDLAPIPQGRNLPAGFVPGALARSDVIGDAVTAGVNGWRDLGHAKADLAVQQITAIHDQDRLDVSIEIAPGPRLTFGPLIVTGNVRMRTERVVAIAGLPDGDVFSPYELEQAAIRLRRAGPFQSVALIEAEEISPGDILNIEAQVIELPLRRFGFGAEISSLDGLSANAFWLHRNLLGGAEQLRFDAEVTGIEGNSGGPDALLEATFNRPGTIHPDVDVELTAALGRLDEPSYFLEYASVTGGFTRYIRQDLTYDAAIGFLTAREETDIRTRNYTLLTVPLSALLDRRDDRFDARGGYYIDLDVTPFLGLIGGDDGIRVYADARYYRSFGDRLTFAARGQFGSVIGANLLETPADFLFYSGGGSTVRGQPYNTLGISTNTTDDDGNPVTVVTGGASFIGAQLEARVGITGSLGVVGFYDAGFVDSAEFPSDTGEFHAGAGIGVRYATPIGPIRFDLATPASGDDAGQSLEFYIGIGQSF